MPVKVCFLYIDVDNLLFCLEIKQSMNGSVTFDSVQSVKVMFACCNNLGSQGICLHDPGC